jgi:hypothetical protein
MLTVMMVIGRRHRRDLRRNFHNPHRKKFARGIDARRVHRVSNNLYGDAARGCLHSGNGPDARKRTISKTAYVSESLSVRVRGETDGVAEEVRVGAILTTSSHRMEPTKPMEPIGSTSLGEGGTANGS